MMLRLLVLFALTSPAAAYVRRDLPTGAPLVWTSGCHALRMSVARDFTVDELDFILARAVANWQSKIAGCSSQQLTALTHDQPTSPDDIVVSFADDWPPPEVAADCAARGPGACDGIVAFTLLETRKPSSPPAVEDANIVGARMVLNQGSFTFYDATGPGGCSGYDGQDLENTLTHELGHLLALGHTCLLPGETASAPLDSDGRVIALCSASSPPDVVAATMYPESYPCSTDLRSLSDDDVAGVCQPYAGPAPTCSSVAHGGCSYAPGASVGGWVLLVMVWLRRRKGL